MNHLKIYEDYSDEDINSLLSDLEKVGQVKSATVVCRVKKLTPQEITNPTWWAEYPEVFSIVKFPDRGSEEANKRFALEKIKKGEFGQRLQKLGLDESKVMGKENVQKIALKSSTLEDFLNKVSSQLVDVIFDQWEEKSEKYLRNKSPREIEEFLKHIPEWCSTPKKAWNEMYRIMDPKIKTLVE